jgi:hypothetical protein
MRVAVREPMAVGLKVMPTVQVADEATAAPQLLLAMAKSPGLAPMIDTLLTGIALEPAFCAVTDWVALLDPTLTDPKVSAGGPTVRIVDALWLPPLPESDTVSIGLTPECLNVSVAERLPAAEGENSKVTAQLEAAARVEPHVLLEIEKSPALVPEIAMLLMVMEPEPPLVRVTVWGSPTDPTSTLPQVTTMGATPTAAIDEQPVVQEMASDSSRERTKAILPREPTLTACCWS